MKDNNRGWTEEMSSIHDTFHWNNRMLYVLFKLDLLDPMEYRIMQSYFEQDIWEKIRNGEDDGY